MALIGFDGFDHYSSNPVIDLRVTPFGLTGTWAITGTVPAIVRQAGLLGGFALTNGGPSFVTTATLVLGANYTTFIIGHRYLIDNPVDAIQEIMHFDDGATTQCGLSVDATGHLFFWRATSATVLATSTARLFAGSWYMIEAKVTIDNAAGSFEVRLDGVTVLSASGVDTQNGANAYINQLVRFFVPGDASAIDDLYMCDTTGPAPYNDFLGIVRVETLFVTTNNSVTWTPLASTNASQVDEVAMDSDTTYNSISTTGIDTFNHGALSSTPVTIFQADILSAARKTDVGILQYRNRLISGGSTASGATSGLATVYQYVRDSYQLDPNTSATWASTDLNATKIGYERF